MITTWEVWRRMIFLLHGTHVTHEKCVAICATQVLALDEAARVIAIESSDTTIPDYERAAVYVKPGSLMLGFGVVP